MLCHVYPRKGNGLWQRNLEEVRARLALFNGRRVIGIVHDGFSDPPEAVQEFFRGYGEFDWVIEKNDPGLREVQTFNRMYEIIEAASKDKEDHALFYCHAKGVTKPFNPGITCHPWARTMYAVSLDYRPLVEEQLEKFPVTGAFKKVGVGFNGSRSQWHYSGSYYWMRCKDIFSRAWREIDWCWYGIEPWPSLHYGVEEAGCLFMDGLVPRLNLYGRKFWQKIVEPTFERWKLENQKYLDLTYGADKEDERQRIHQAVPALAPAVGV